MSFTKVPYRIIPLGRCIAAKLYIELVNDNPITSFSEHQIEKLFEQSISVNLISKALSAARGNAYDREALFSRHGTKKEGYTYSLTEVGIRQVELASRDRSSDISFFLENGDKSLDQIAGPNAIFWTKQEYLSTTIWAPIELDESDPIYSEAIDAVDEALEEIQKNNELAADYPKEKEGIVRAIEYGINTLKTKMPTKAQLTDFLVKPLKWIASKFGQTTLGEFAKIAAQKIVDLISSAFGF